MQLRIAILFLLTVYVGLSIARDIYWDIHTRPPKKSDTEGRKVLTRKINTTRERVE